MNIEIPEKTDLEYEFLYQFYPSEIHQEIIDHFKGYIQENEKWIKKCNFEASIRARNHLLALHKLTRQRRAEIAAEREETK
jgi:hypothetical protein